MYVVEQFGGEVLRVSGHLQLPRDVEFPDRVIWSARIEDGLVAEWRLYPDTPESHKELGIRFDEEG